MSMWILAVIAGFILAGVGMAKLVGRYRRGEISGRYLWAVVVGCLSLASFAMADAFYPHARTGALLLLVPGLVAIVVFVRERQRQKLTLPVLHR